jgi:phage terminase small subunit
VPNPRQLHFLDEYLIDHNGAQAAIRAGYSPWTAKVQASQLLSDPNLQAVLKTKQQALQNRLEISKERVISELLATIEQAKANLDPMAQIRGWAEVAKLLGFYAPEKRQVGMSLSGRVLMSKYEGMSDEELMRLATVGMEVGAPM